jgi:hypothetical protein
MTTQPDDSHVATDDEAGEVSVEVAEGDTTYALTEFLDSGEETAIIPTLEVLRYFGRERRGAAVIKRIENWVSRNDLEMLPDIAEADYYGSVTVRRSRAERSPLDAPATSPAASTPAGTTPGVNSWILSSLKDDAEELDFIVYGASVEDAINMMKEGNRTKLPMFFSAGDMSTLIGTVTLTELTFENTEPASRLIEKANTQVPVVSTNEKLFDWIPTILSHGFIYGKDQDGNIVQIYTTHDVASHLNAITALFLRANEIEELVREALVRVDEQELRSARSAGRSLTTLDLDGQGKTFENDEINPGGGTDADQRFVDTLTFADYMKCISAPTIWATHFTRPDIPMIDKERCIRSLNDARLARNAVMHFNRGSSLSNLIPSFEALAVWLRRLVSDPSPR